MTRLIVAAMAVVWALAGWRNMPRLDQPVASAAGLSVAGCVVFAYLLGRRRSAAVAMAVATARAEATALAAVTADTRSAAHANVVINLDPAVGARRAGAVTGLESAPWLAGATPDPAQLVEAETDYADSVLAEFAEDRQAEGETA